MEPSLSVFRTQRSDVLRCELNSYVLISYVLNHYLAAMFEQGKAKSLKRTDSGGHQQSLKSTRTRSQTRRWF